MAEIKVGFNIVSIREGKFSYTPPIWAEIDQFDPNKLNIGFGINLDPSELQSDLLILNMLVVYQYAAANGEMKELLSLEAHFKFRIENINKYAESLQEGISLPEGVIIEILNIGVSTLRGMVAVKAAETFLSDYPIQVIDIHMLANNVLTNHKK